MKEEKTCIRCEEKFVADNEDSDKLWVEFIRGEHEVDGFKPILCKSCFDETFLKFVRTLLF